MITLKFQIPLWAYCKPDGKIGGWTQERLLALKREKPAVFARLFEGRAVDVGDMTFPPIDQWPTYSEFEDIPDFENAPAFGFLDPAGGKGKGDFAAIGSGVIGGDGLLYLLDFFMSQSCTPMDAVQKILILHNWIGDLPGRHSRGYQTFGIEDNNFQELICDVLMEKQREEGRIGSKREVPVAGITVSGKKELRILGMQPDLANGRVLVPPDASTRWPILARQLEGFGPGSLPEHDDGPDTLASLIELSRGAAKFIKTTKKKGSIHRPAALAAEGF